MGAGWWRRIHHTDECSSGGGLGHQHVTSEADNGWCHNNKNNNHNTATEDVTEETRDGMLLACKQSERAMQDEELRRFGRKCMMREWRGRYCCCC